MAKYLFEIKPSMSVEGFFVHQCERNLFYNGIPGKQRRSFGLNRPVGSGSSIAALAGNDWEEYVVNNYISKCVHIKTEVKKGVVSYLKYNPKETIEELVAIERSVRKNRTREYLYQGCLTATEECMRELFRFDEDVYTGRDAGLQVAFTRTYPDLIRADWSVEDDSVILSVVDIKLARRMRLPHKVQVTLYVKLLKWFVEEYNKDKNDGDRLNVKINEKEGYLWNGGQETERAFLLAETNELLDDYFSVTIPGLVNKVRACISAGRESEITKRLDRCVGPKCEWCGNCKQCLDELKGSKSTSVIPYLTAYAQEFARDLGAPASVDDLRTFILSDHNRQLLSCNRTWDYILKDGTTIEVQSRAAPYNWGDIWNTEYKWKNKKSLTMPRWQDVMILITAQKYAGTGKVYACAVLVKEYIGGDTGGDREMTPKWKEETNVFIADDISVEAYHSNIKAFVLKMHEILTHYHEKNANRKADDKGTSLQGYVMDSYELKNLEEVLYDVLESGFDADIKEKAMQILFWIQGERLVSDGSQHPKYETEYPVIVINSEIRKLLSLPLSVAYRLPEIISAMKIKIDKDRRFNKVDHRIFFEYISNVMRSDAIHEYWKDRKQEIREEILEHIEKRLYAESRILLKMQGEGREKKSIMRAVAPFVMPGKVDYSKELLRKWFFEVKLENLLDYHQSRSTRLEGIDVTQKSGDAFEAQIVEVTKTKNDRGYDETTVTLMADDTEGVFREEWYSAIMTDKADVDELYGFDDYRNPKLNPSWKTYNKNKIAIVNFMTFDKTGNVLKISGKTVGKSYEKADVGKTVYIVPRFTDLNSEKIIGEFFRLDMDDEGKLLDPQNLNEQIYNDYAVIEKTMLSYSRSDGMSFYGSQEDAFRHLYENRLTVLQGPPGTGKTDFIARSVITLCRYYHEQEQRQLRVLVCANSHAAIENVMFMIDRKMGSTADISLYKASRFDGEDSKVRKKGRVEIVGDGKNDEDNYLTVTAEKDGERPVVLGATNWSCAKLQDRAEFSGEEFVFDLVIIDEASQVRVMDALLALNRGDTSSSRYLLVGDGDQLPAIIRGQYGKESDCRYEYGSIFDFFREQIKDRLMLCDCFRMNEILLRYSAEKIYGREYHSIDELKHKRWLRYRNDGIRMDEITDHILDGYTDREEEYWPLVFCRISGATPLEQNNAEIVLASKLTEAVRNKVDYAPCDDDMLWKGSDGKDGVLGIVSPHHKHIQKLKDRICADTGMPRDNLYIGTVDKLQGQQREVVIVSYGVTDLESAVTEGEFIFNRNRLNVALTRAKCKSITIFSEILTKAAPGMLDTEDEDLQKGIEFVCGFHAFMQRTEDDTEIDHKRFTMHEDGCNGVIVDVYRKRVLI